MTRREGAALLTIGTPDTESCRNCGHTGWKPICQSNPTFIYRRNTLPACMMNRDSTRLSITRSAASGRIELHCRGYKRR